MTKKPVAHDKIYIRDLLWRCIIGINEDERIYKQDVLINIVLYVNLQKAGQTDNIEDSVNYKTIKKEILKLLDDSQFYLIEKLAEEIAKICLSFKKVHKTTITVDKPGALRFTRSVAVEITRSKDQYE